MLDLTKVVFIFMLLKLFQVKQNLIINCIPNRKAIAFINKNNQKAMQQTIATKNHIHIFISPKIALLKMFKANIVNNQYFSNRFLFSAINKIYLIEK